MLTKEVVCSGFDSRSDPRAVIVLPWPDTTTLRDLPGLKRRIVLNRNLETDESRMQRV